MSRISLAVVLVFAMTACATADPQPAVAPQPAEDQPATASEPGEENADFLFWDMEQPSRDVPDEGEPPVMDGIIRTTQRMPLFDAAAPRPTLSRSRRQSGAKLDAYTLRCAVRVRSLPSGRRTIS